MRLEPFTSWRHSCTVHQYGWVWATQTSDSHDTGVTTFPRLLLRLRRTRPTSFPGPFPWRSQGLSSLAPGDGKMRDPVNEDAYSWGAFKPNKQITRSKSHDLLLLFYFVNINLHVLLNLPHSVLIHKRCCLTQNGLNLVDKALVKLKKECFPV